MKMQVTSSTHVIRVENPIDATNDPWSVVIIFNLIQFGPECISELQNWNVYTMCNGIFSAPGMHSGVINNTTLLYYAKELISIHMKKNPLI